VATYDDNGTELPVKVRLQGLDSRDATSLGSLQIPNPMGSSIALSSVAHITKAPAPSRIERFSGMRAVQVTANYAGKDLNAVMKVLEAETKKRMTPETTYSVEGQGRIMAESMASFATTLLLAIILVWMVLAAQFESYMTPLVIMLSVSLSFVGAILGLLITGREFSMYPMIGILLLVGIVTKNAILLIDFALQRMRTGMPVDNALLEAGPIRLRPILMTTFAMIFGMVPIAIGHGDGGEARAPMAIAVIGGLITSTVLTLVIIPCVFSLFQSVKARYYGKELLKHT
jgi:HAE1 family hydrophobic/amphiphilic exporter-1